jgi:rare lipoprotein A
MQTKLRLTSLFLVAGLLWTCPAPAAPQKAVRHQAMAHFKPRYLGVASWYGQQHQGRKMANGKRFDKNKMTAASWYFPLGSVVRVVNLENGKSAVVTITDRGPNLRLHRLIDLSEGAARQLDYVSRGLTRVFVAPVVSVETVQAEIDAHWVEPPVGSDE